MRTDPDPAPAPEPDLDHFVAVFLQGASLPFALPAPRGRGAPPRPAPPATGYHLGVALVLQAVVDLLQREAAAELHRDVAPLLAAAAKLHYISRDAAAYVHKDGASAAYTPQ